MSSRSTPMPIPPVGRHAVLQGADVVRVEGVGFLVAGRPLACLLLEAAALVVGIVELAERIGELAAVDEQLETLGERGIGAVRLGERRERPSGNPARTWAGSAPARATRLEHFVLQPPAGQLLRPGRRRRHAPAGPARISASVAVRRSRPQRDRTPSMNRTLANGGLKSSVTPLRSITRVPRHSSSTPYTSDSVRSIMSV